jgi:hypothetical protein
MERKGSKGFDEWAADRKNKNAKANHTDQT